MVQIKPALTHLTPEEIDEAIRCLSEAGWNRLWRIAKAYSRQRLYEPEDLIQEAITRALEGSRHCPRNIDIIKFLAEAMRSISSDKAKALERRPELKFAEVKPITDEEDKLEFEPSDNEPSPEQQLLSTHEVEKIKEAVLQLFDDDEIAQIMIEGVMEGMNGEELRLLTDLDETAFNSKRRLIRRRLDKAFPEGWQS